MLKKDNRIANFLVNSQLIQFRGNWKIDEILCSDEIIFKQGCLGV